MDPIEKGIALADDRAATIQPRTLAARAIREFAQTDLIPQLGQRTEDVVGPGTLHIFPDGSIAIHGDDGTFVEGEWVEEEEG